MNYLYISNIDTIKNPSLITPWSTVHFLSGCYLFAFGEIWTKNILINFSIGIIIHTLYEIKDIYMSSNCSNIKNWKHNSLWNSFGDTICFALGFLMIYVGNLNNVLYKNIILFVYWILLAIFFNYYRKKIILD